jgi:predicted NAD/FAD-binding protein
MRIAIVGSGIAGLTCAHLLHPRHEVMLYEVDGRPGGHTNTVEVEVDGDTHAVDTGFIVYNERTYPGFVRLLRELGVGTKDSEMSFGVSDERAGLEWRGTSLSSLFAQRRNIVNPAFRRMLVDVVRFNRAARHVAAGDADPDLTLGEFLARRPWSRAFIDWYLTPMGSAIWSAAPTSFAEMPMLTFARFFDNHGLLRVGDQPKWRTVAGGAARYVDALLRPMRDRLQLGAGVEKVVRRRAEGTVELRTTDGGPAEFDHVILATHSDQALRLLADPSAAEHEILGAIRYQPNRAILHTDEALLPRSVRARASWNYHRPRVDPGVATITYDMNRLQGIESRRPILVTLNREADIDPAAVLRAFDYDHPVLDAGAVRAQSRRDEINGRHGTWFAGAYWGHGFHEDGVQSALHVCRGLGIEVGW